MKSGGRAKTNATPAEQLAAENDWLVGRHLPESFRATLPEPSQADQEIDERVRAILSDARLARFLRIIERHNSRPRQIPGRRLPQKDHFLLGPHLRQVVMSVQARNELRQRLPMLDQPAAEVRNHLQKVAADCKALADLVRKGPQPHVALAGETNTNEWLKVFAPWTELFEAADGSERQVVAFAELLQRAGGWFDALAGRVPRARQNRRPAATAASAEAADLRTRAAEFLPGVFRKRLGHSYRAHVATIATVVSELETDEDFVKKVHRRRSESNNSGDKISREITETVPCADT